MGTKAKLFKHQNAIKCMKLKRLGNYQRTVLKGIERKGSQPSSIRKGYSRQVKSLLKRDLIRNSNDRLYLTEKGKKRIKNLK